MTYERYPQYLAAFQMRVLRTLEGHDLKLLLKLNFDHILSHSQQLVTKESMRSLLLINSQRYAVLAPPTDSGKGRYTKRL